MSEQAEVVDASEEILEGAAEVVEGVAQIARGFSGLALSGAFVVGAGLGGALGYIFCKRQLETKYSQFAADEIAEMREHFHAKAIALENSVDKPKLDEIVRDQGYSTEQSDPPMAVTPPASVVEAAAETSEEEPVPGVKVVDTGESEAGEAPKPTQPETRNVFRDAQTGDEWDAYKERARRSPLTPYVIHRDEREEHEMYDDITLTYYEDDDVLCNESDTVFDKDERDRVIGEENLERFGHGSGDASIVYIRNDQMETVFTVVRSPNSYAEEVHGFDPSPDESELRHSHRRQARRAIDDD